MNVITIEERGQNYRTLEKFGEEEGECLIPDRMELLDMEPGRLDSTLAARLKMAREYHEFQLKKHL